MLFFASFSQTTTKASRVVQTVDKVCVGLHEGQIVLSELAFVVVVR